MASGEWFSPHVTRCKLLWNWALAARVDGSLAIRHSPFAQFRPPVSKRMAAGSAIERLMLSPAARTNRAGRVKARNPFLFL
jgi:hypothetical protein